MVDRFDPLIFVNHNVQNLFKKRKYIGIKNEKKYIAIKKYENNKACCYK